ncbi:MAG: hypothetical protein VKQ33_03240 [Candidatus Sericytochromatia bacterium]|nr:hypothetical protein [Candidatus Sericytochromatia bacterium]
MRTISPLALVMMLAVSGCSAVAPTGQNVASFPAYRTPDEAGQVELVHTLVGEDAASATFFLGLPEQVAADLGLEEPVIEGRATPCLEPLDGDVCAAFDTSTLPAGFYPVDIYEGDAEEPAASATIVVKEALAPVEEDADGSGTAQ